MKTGAIDRRRTETRVFGEILHYSDSNHMQEA